MKMTVNKSDDYSLVFLIHINIKYFQYTVANVMGIGCKLGQFICY